MYTPGQWIIIVLLIITDAFVALSLLGLFAGVFYAAAKPSLIRFIPARLHRG